MKPDQQQNSLFSTPKAIQSELQTIRVEFDGGTPCNIPRLGYGIGYGSYKINGQPIVRVTHGIPMSANVAEIMTLVSALKDVQVQFGNRVKVKIFGDSQIALNWAAGHTPSGKKKKFSKKVNQPFRDAVDALRLMTTQFSIVTTNWRGRAKSVELFGH